ncbi:MAG: hypothetical protein RIR39_1821, partial [Pseudomonadota bacterium]
FDNHNFDFWGALSKERKYNVERDDVATAYDHADKLEFPWLSVEDNQVSLNVGEHAKNTIQGYFELDNYRTTGELEGVAQPDKCEKTKLLGDAGTGNHAGTEPKAQESIARQQQNHKQMLIDVQVEAMRIIEADKLGQQGNEKQQVNVDAGKDKVRKKLKPLERETSEGLLLIYEILNHYMVKYQDNLSGHKAWGKIISKEFSSELISSIATSNKYITLSGGEKLYKTDFGDKYRKRFE